jgi:hypothetical protein
VPPSPTPARPPQPESVADALQAAVRGGFGLTALTIKYRVGIEAWGRATTLVIQGSGAVDLTHSLTGEHSTWTSTMTEDELQELVRLLVGHKVWAIRGQRETGMPDEARPNVIITAGGLEPLYVGMWDNEAAEHPDFGPIVRELDSLAYQIKSGPQNP